MKELNENELRCLDGGVINPFIPLLAGLVIGALLSEWPGFKRGFIEGFKAGL